MRDDARRALDVLGALRTESGATWAATATPWQRRDAEAILGGEPEHHFLTRPRGGRKSSDLAAITIAALLEQIPAGGSVVAFAADADQAGILHRAAVGYVQRTGLGGLIEVQARKLTNRRTGAFLSIESSDAPSAFGLLGVHLIVVDEVAQWPQSPSARQLWDAIVSTVPKVETCRLVLLSTAGSPGHWSFGVWQHARASSEWRASSVPGPLPWRSERVLGEQRALLTESQYARLHLNEWVASEDALVNPDALDRCVTLDGPLPPKPGVRYVIACDLGITNDRSVAVVAHAEPVDAEGAARAYRVVLDRMQVWQGSKVKPVELAQVEEWLATAHEEFNRGQVIVDPWQAVGMVQHLRQRRVRVETFNFGAQSVGRLAATLYTLLRDGLLALPPDAELLDELRSVRLRENSAGVVRLDHDSRGHDDRAIALALAAHHLAERAGRQRPVPRVSCSSYEPEVDRDVRSGRIRRLGC
jgi:phage terminase large subunit-like protein